MTNTTDLEVEILVLRDALADATGGHETRLRLMVESRERQLADLRREAAQPTAHRYPIARWATPRAER